jgi:hypothetical protein
MRRILFSENPGSHAVVGAKAARLRYPARSLAAHKRTIGGPALEGAAEGCRYAIGHHPPNPQRESDAHS